jgi:FecR protein
MKKIQAMFCAALGGAVLTLAITAPADDLKQGVATVIRVKGQASYTLGGNDEWHPLVAGKILRAGSTVSTKPDAVVDIVLGKQIRVTPSSLPDRPVPSADSPVQGLVATKPSIEQNIVRLSGGTTLKIDTLTVSDTGVDTVSDTELDLQAGRIFASVKKLDESSKYLVKIPNGIAGVRGTKFTLGADGSAGCIEHSVWLAFGGAAPTTVQVNAGDQYNPATGQSGPLSPATLSLLNEIALASVTGYSEPGDYAVDYSRENHISPTDGYFPQP